jgi:hypothetical protein
MKKLWLPAFVFVSSLAIYILTLAPSVPLQGDAGELITVAYTLGIAHPPGYPLYTLLAHLFTLLPLGSVAWRVNLFSALTHAVTLVIFFVLVKKLTKSDLAAAGGALILGFSQLFWLYSLVAEVFALNDLFVLLIVYLAIAKKYSLLAFIVGLSLSNHHTIILIFPALAYFLWPDWKKLLRPKLAVLFLVGLLPYLYFIIRAKTAVMPVAWSYPGDLESLIRLVTRADYGSLAPALGLDPALATIGEKGQQLLKFFRYSGEDFLLVSAPLALLAVVWGWAKQRRLIIFLALAYFVSGPFFLTYANFPINDPTGFGLVAVERFYLQPYLFMALAIALGLAYLQKFRFLGPVIAVFYLSLLFWNNFPIVDQRGNFWGLELGKNILSSAPSHSIILMQGDIPTLTAFYVRYVENFRPDVELLTPNLPGPANGYRYLRQVFPELDWGNPKALPLAEVVKRNYRQVPIAAFGPLDLSPVGLVASPSGFLSVFRQASAEASFKSWKTENEQLVSRYSFPTAPDRHNTLADYSLVWYYTRMLSGLGSVCYLNADYDCAVNYYLRATALNPWQLRLKIGLAQALAKKGDCAAAERTYLAALDLNPAAGPLYFYLQDLAKTCFQDEAKAQYYAGKTREVVAGSPDSLEKL